MAVKTITCIICPMGCDITVEGEGDNIASMSGNQCVRGEKYAGNEFSHPVRILTSLVKVAGGSAPLVPVRSTRSLPKELLFDCMAAIRGATVPAPVERNQVIIADVCGTGVDIVATGEVERANS